MFIAFLSSNLWTVFNKSFFQTGASPSQGLLDMAGNVWEWMADSYQKYYSDSPGSLQIGGASKVLRGGRLECLRILGARNVPPRLQSCVSVRMTFC
jgi:formylglycine-generating enzyme required for sulfatase activity